MALDTTSNNNALPIYRFKFSEHFMDELKILQIHIDLMMLHFSRNDGLVRTSNDFNIENNKEEKRLSETGYDGDTR